MFGKLYWFRIGGYLNCDNCINGGRCWLCCVGWVMVVGVGCVVLVR